MNPRIAQLIEQATEDILTAEGDWIGSQVNQEKFAELIIRECIENLYFHGHDEAASQLMYLKTNRFGVK